MILTTRLSIISNSDFSPGYKVIYRERAALCMKQERWTEPTTVSRQDELLVYGFMLRVEVLIVQKS